MSQGLIGTDITLGDAMQSVSPSLGSMHRSVRFIEICGPVDYREQRKTHGKHHEGISIESPMLGATKHDALVHLRTDSSDEASYFPVPRQWFQNWRILFAEEYIMRISSILNYF